VKRKGHIARAGRLKRLALRNKQDLSDLETNTRKRRRLARRLAKEQPLFAYLIMCKLIKGYKLSSFNRDSKATKSFRAKHKVQSARKEFHEELVTKIHAGPIENKVITRLHLNWNHKTKPFTFFRFGVTYTFPRSWSLKQIRQASLQMQQAQDLTSLDKLFDNLTSFGN